MRNEYRKSDSKSITTIYHDELKKCEPIVSKELEKKLIHQAKCGDITSRNQIVKSNLRFVFNTARKYVGKGVPFDDLISEGNMALIYAIDKYDEGRDVRFITYASWWVRFFITDLVKKNYMRGLNEISEDVFINHNKDISNNADEELSSYDNNAESHERVVSEQRNQEEIVNDLLSTLTPRERDVLECYYGLKGGREMNLGELSEKYGISKERIRQIKLTGLSKMRSEVLLLDDFNNDMF